MPAGTPTVTVSNSAANTQQQIILDLTNTRGIVVILWMPTGVATGGNFSIFDENNVSVLPTATILQSGNTAILVVIGDVEGAPVACSAAGGPPATILNLVKYGGAGNRRPLSLTITSQAAGVGIATSILTSYEKNL